MKTFVPLMTLLFCLRAAIAAEISPANSGDFTNFVPNLPILFLDTTQRIVSEMKVPCTVRLMPTNSASSMNTGALTGVVRYHGASSQMYQKKSYGLTLDASVRWLGMKESKNWVLMAATVDRSLMRHKISYDLFRALSSERGKRYAAASQFIEVKRQDQYRGVYLLMERVDRGLLEFANYDSNAPVHACIYKAVDHGADFSRTGHGSYEQREPNPLLGEYWKPLEDINGFVSRAPDTEFFDAANGIASRLDLDNTIDFHLLVLLTSNMDGYDKNLIIARNAPTAKEPKPKFFFVPWDYDATFGRNWNATPTEYTAWLSNHLFDRLLNNASYRAKFAARWNELRQSTFSVESIHRMIDDNARTLGPAVKRNEARWHTLQGPYPDHIDFEQDIAEMKVWIVARLKWLDEEIARRCSAKIGD